MKKNGLRTAAGLALALAFAVALPVAGAAAKTKPLKNGDFEKGSLKNWKTAGTSSQDFVAYKNSDRFNPPSEFVNSEIWASLLKPLGTYSAAAIQAEEGDQVLYRTIKVPKKATKIKAKLGWVEYGNVGFQAGDTPETENGDQYFSFDLIKKSADPGLDEESKILKEIYRPATGPIMPLAGTAGSGPANPTPFFTVKANVKKLQGKKVTLRLATWITQNELNTTIDKVAFKVKKK